MKNIGPFFEHITQSLQSDKFRDCTFPVFRGHGKHTYELLPTLHRDYVKTDLDLWTLENNLYCDFRSLVGPRVSFRSSWETLFAMRHEGIPTRLLDWTENIGTALFFALNSKDIDKPHIWILNPFALNEKNSDARGALVNPEEDLPAYSETYAVFCNNSDCKDGDGDPRKIKIHELPLAIYPNRSNDRILAQRGIFTIHGLIEFKMELTCSDFIDKIEIPEVIVDELRLLIKYFGINSYSVYPDLKGLCDYLKEMYRY